MTRAMTIRRFQPSRRSSDGTMRREEEELAKRTVLADLRALGVVDKEWTMDDRVEDMMLELRRHALIADEKKNVTMMRDGLRLFASGVELLNNRLGLLDLDGWSTELARDLPKHDASLARIYRKYWRRGSSNSPEADLAFAILGSMSMHHIKRTMSKSLMQRSTRRGAPARPRTPDPDSSSDGSAVTQRVPYSFSRRPKKIFFKIHRMATRNTSARRMGAVFRCRRVGDRNAHHSKTHDPRVQCTHVDPCPRFRPGSVGGNETLWHCVRTAADPSALRLASCSNARPSTTPTSTSTP